MVAHLMLYKISAIGGSDIGRVRQNNEDIWAQLPEIGFFILADGMGGHQAGEVAAREAVSSLCRVIKKKLSAEEALSLSDTKELMRRAIRNVNSTIHKMSKMSADLRGMGTTLCCLLFHRDGLIIAHVGDSRIYQFRNQKLRQLTKDHSLLRELVEQGHIDEQQADDFLYKNIITKAIGTESKVEPSVEQQSISNNDIYMMCSDGLSDLLTHREIEEILNSHAAIDDAAQTFISEANKKGGSDNITVVIVKVEGVDDATNLP